MVHKWFVGPCEAVVHKWFEFVVVLEAVVHSWRVQEAQEARFWNRSIGEVVPGEVTWIDRQ